MPKKIWVGRPDRNFILFWNFISAWSFWGWVDLCKLLLTFQTTRTVNNGPFFAETRGRKRSLLNKMCRFLSLSRLMEDLSRKRSWYHTKQVRNGADRLRRTPSWILASSQNGFLPKFTEINFFSWKIEKNFVESAKFFWLGRDIGNKHFFFFGLSV